MVDDLEFARLVAAAQAGDTRSLEAVFRAVQPRLLRYLRTQERRHADDLAAEVWLAVAHGLTRFEGGGREFRSWVFSIAHRRVADHRRRGIRRGETSIGSDAIERSVAPAGAPDDEVISGLAGQAAADLITRVLPLDQAEVVLLRVLADLDTDDVARLLGRSTTWVRVTQHRALRKLAEHLDENSWRSL